MAGHTIALYFGERGHDVTAFSRKPFPYCRNVQGDATDTETLRELLTADRYDAVINCIGLLNRFAEENPSKAVFLNGYLPHFIADTLRDTPAKLIQMSTDCVFAGNTGPYTEKSVPDGRTLYDRTKAMGEVDNGKDLTFRNSIIGPDIDPEGIGLFHWFMRQRGPIQGYTHALWTGVTTLTLAQAMERAIGEDLTGLYHLVGEEPISKYDLLQLFNKYFRGGAVVIRPFGEFKLDKTLKCTRKGDFSFAVPDYERMVAEMKAWIDRHSSLYPFYK